MPFYLFSRWLHTLWRPGLTCHLSPRWRRASWSQKKAAVPRAAGRAAAATAVAVQEEEEEQDEEQEEEEEEEEDEDEEGEGEEEAAGAAVWHEMQRLNVPGSGDEPSSKAKPNRALRRQPARDDMKMDASQPSTSLHIRLPLLDRSMLCPQRRCALIRLVLNQLMDHR
jgi:hypothetical protein